MGRTAPPADGASESALARLLEAEARLEAALAVARREADAMRVAAEAAAAARLARVESELVAAGNDLAVRIAAAARSRIAAEREALERRRAQYAAVEDSTLERLARWVTAEVLSAVGQEAP